MKRTAIFLVLFFTVATGYLALMGGKTVIS